MAKPQKSGDLKRKLFEAMSSISAPITVSGTNYSETMILYKGVKLTRRTARGGFVEYIVQDASGENYSRIENAFILQSLITAINGIESSQAERSESDHRRLETART